MKKLLELSDDTFEEKTKKGVTLVDFYATWCSPCKKLAPIFEQTAQVYPDVLFAKAEAQNDCVEAVARVSVQSVPTLILYCDGAPVARYSGVTFDTTQKLQHWLDSEIRQLKLAGMM